MSCSREGLQRGRGPLHRRAGQGRHRACSLATGLGYVENHATADITKGLIRTPLRIDHHRSLLDPSTVSDVHRGHRHQRRQAVRAGHAAARQPRQDRRDRNSVDHHGLLAVQRGRVSEVVVQRELGRHSPRAARHARHPGGCRQRVSRRVPRRSEGRRAVGSARATARKAARTRGTARRWTVATSACRAA